MQLRASSRGDDDDADGDGTSSSTCSAARYGAQGELVRLSSTEFELLHYLMRNSGRVLTP